MFYYSETKYLYEAKGSQLQPGMKGFVKITFRGQKGAVQIHLGDRSQNGREETRISLYLSSKKRPLGEILRKDYVIENGKLQFHCTLEENCSGEEGIWFGCLIQAQNRRYTEDSAHTEALLANGNVSPDNLIHVDFSKGKKQEKEEFAIAEYAQEYHVEWPQKDQTFDEEKNLPEESEETDGIMPENDNAKQEKREYDEVPDEASDAVPDDAETGESQQPAEPRCIWDEIYITDLNKLEGINERWKSFLQNSFLLHGFYNYKHVIATGTLLGVPGNYYEREKKVAAMFGFNSFLSPNELENYLAGAADFLEETIEAGTFGYYLCQIPAR